MVVVVGAPYTPVLVCVENFSEGVAWYKCEERACRRMGHPWWGIAGHRSISRMQAMTMAHACLNLTCPHTPLSVPCELREAHGKHIYRSDNVLVACDWPGSKTLG